MNREGALSDNMAGFGLPAKDHRLWLACIVLVGLLLRLWGLDFGLPNVNTRPDESTLVHKAIAFGSGDLNPHFFKYPSLHFYLLAGVYGLYFAAGLGLGLFAGVQDFQRQFFSDPSIFFLLGRVALGQFHMYYNVTYGPGVCGNSQFT